MKNLSMVEKLRSNHNIIFDEFKKIKSGDWTLIPHTHYDELRVSVWKNFGIDAMFFLKNGSFEVSENENKLVLNEPKLILNKWLRQEFNDANKCNWQQEKSDDYEAWRPKCSPNDGYVSGVNDLKEMKATYTFCTKCGKKIVFINKHGT